MERDVMAVYDQKHLLYCDILGFSRTVLDQKADPAKLLFALSDLEHTVRLANYAIDVSVVDTSTGHRPDYVVSPRAEQFSDCIVISTPATNIDAIWLCEAAAAIQNTLSSRGFLSRGAISTGPLYHTETTIFGPALIKATCREKATKWPRIEVSAETLRYFRDADEAESREICLIRERQLLISEDSGIVRVDPFHQLKFFATQSSPAPHQYVAPAIEGWRRTLTAGLLSSDRRAFAKHVWMARQFNEALAKRGSWIAPIEIPRSRLWRRVRALLTPPSGAD